MAANRSQFGLTAHAVLESTAMDNQQGSICVIGAHYASGATIYINRRA